MSLIARVRKIIWDENDPENCFFIFEKNGLYHSGKSGCYLWKDPIFKVLPLTNTNMSLNTSKLSVVTRVNNIMYLFIYFSRKAKSVKTKTRNVPPLQEKENV